MKKQCDHLAIASSSLSLTASESDPEDSFWRDFTFDFSFLTSDDQKSGLGDDIDSNAGPKESELYGLAIVDSNVTMVEERSPPLASVLGVTTTTPVAKNDWIAKGKEACLRNESTFSPLFAKMSALRIKECSNGSVQSDQDDTEMDSPCWKGSRSRNIAESGISSVNLRRSRDDLNVLYGLNPMAPQFIPSNAKMNTDKNGKEFGENGSLSLKRSLSSTFPPSSGEFSISNLYEAGIEQGSDQTNSIGIIIHDADESLGLVCQDNVSETNQFQRRTKLDPLAPVFVPAYAVVHEKSVVADHMISTERNAHSSYASSEVGHIGSNPYSDNVHQPGKIYSSNPGIGSQVQISENTKLNSSSNKTHGFKKKLNPLAPQFSLADTKPKVYGSVENQIANDLPTNVNSNVLFSPVSYKELHAGLPHPSVHVEPSYKEVDTKQMRRHRSFISHGNSSPQMDVKKLLTTIHGLSELLTHVHGSETSGSPNQQDLDLINSTVQNLNSYMNTGKYDGLTSLPNMCKQSIREHQMPKARNLSSTVDFRRKEKYPMVKGETGAEPQVEYVVTKENGFGQVVRSHETEEQINPQVLFYKSLWLKARADRSLMEYETFLSSSKT
ncbi:hypothetical protein N665_0378s0017 [Sinapis alba]|nr:hypothetical protein N665_0378s0017 [Sinapis alba]